MRIDIITILPEIFQGPFNQSIIKRAKENGIVEIVLHNLRDYSLDKHKRVDDYAFGGEAGMVMCIEPIDRAINALKSQRHYNEIVYASPDGEPFTQEICNSISIMESIIILCGHYKGVDQRVRDHLITREISIGDFVLSGGELAAAAIVDAVVRIIPGAIGDEQSALTDSFQDNLLAPPVYTRPADYNGWKVPEILLSGNTKLIEEWQFEQSIERTKKLRPGMIK
jgi:tRNA (guanine37-N1)-methyltransferase